MCVFVSRPMKIVTLLWKNGDLPKRVVDFPRESVDVYQCDDTTFSSRFEPEECMRTFSQSEPTRLLSSLQRCKSQSATSSQMPQDPGSITQVPTVSLVPFPTLLNTVPTHLTHVETQRVANKTRFPSTPLSEMMTATFSVSAECPLTVAARSRRATNQDNAHQRHTRSVHSSS